METPSRVASTPAAAKSCEPILNIPATSLSSLKRARASSAVSTSSATINLLCTGWFIKCVYLSEFSQNVITKGRLKRQERRGKARQERKGGSSPATLANKPGIL